MPPFAAARSRSWAATSTRPACRWPVVTRERGRRGGHPFRMPPLRGNSTASGIWLPDLQSTVRRALGDVVEAEELARQAADVFRRFDTWSIYVLSALTNFERFCERAVPTVAANSTTAASPAPIINSMAHGRMSHKLESCEFPNQPGSKRTRPCCPDPSSGQRHVLHCGSRFT